MDMKSAITKKCPFFALPLFFSIPTPLCTQLFEQQQKEEDRQRDEAVVEMRRRKTAGFLLSELEPSHASGQSSAIGEKGRMHE